MLSFADAADPIGEHWTANPALLDDMARKKAAYVYREADVKPYVLPDPLVGRDGTRIATKAQWEQTGRTATLELFRAFIYGRSPAGPVEVRFESRIDAERIMNGRATHTRVRIVSADGVGRSFAFEASVLVPTGGTGKAPVFLLINHRSNASADPNRLEQNLFWPVETIIARGYAAAVFNAIDVDPDTVGEPARAKGVRGVWPAGSGTVGADAWATIGAWAWGASRVLDWLQTVSEVDGAHVAVIGHSRGGKAALWAGAQDERFALVISNDSGCAGAALSRRVFGETVGTINKAFPYWFCENFKRYDDKEDHLPVDQHQLLALIAPRALYVASADADFWADQRGEFLSLAHAAPVYAFYGLPGFAADGMPALDRPVVRGVVGYHVRTGGHGLTPYDWVQYLNAADRLWHDGGKGDPQP